MTFVISGKSFNHWGSIWKEEHPWKKISLTHVLSEPLLPQRPVLWQAERGLFWKAGGKGIWTLLDGEGEAGEAWLFK